MLYCVKFLGDPFLKLLLKYLLLCSVIFLPQAHLYAQGPDTEVVEPNLTLQPEIPPIPFREVEIKNDPAPAGMSPEQVQLWNAIFNPQPLYRSVLETLTYDNFSPAHDNFRELRGQQPPTPVHWYEKAAEKNNLNLETSNSLQDFFEHPAVQARIKEGENFRIHYLESLEQHMLQNARAEGFEYDYFLYLRESWEQFLRSKKKYVRSSMSQLSAESSARNEIQNRYPQLKTLDQGRWDYMYKLEYNRLVTRYLNQESGTTQNGITSQDFELWLKSELTKAHNERAKYFKKQLENYLSRSSNTWKNLYLYPITAESPYMSKAGKRNAVTLTAAFLENKFPIYFSERENIFRPSGT